MPHPNSLCLLATVKDERPSLLEWIARHKKIGLEHCVVASKHCSDGTDKMLDRLQAVGVLRHIDKTPPYRTDIQVEAHEIARRCPEVANSEWIMLLDADELLDIHKSEGKVANLVGFHAADTEAIVFN